MKEIRIYLRSNELSDDKLYELDKLLTQLFNTKDIVITTDKVKEVADV